MNQNSVIQLKKKKLEIKIIDLNEEDYLFIIDNIYTEVIEYLQSNGYMAKEYGDYKILEKK